MRVPDDILFFDAPKLDGSEDYHQQTFVNWLRAEHPGLAALLVHVANEGKRTMGQAQRDRLMGMTRGASDIIIPVKMPIVMEMKIWSGRLTADQVQYLRNARDNGAFACVVMGCIGAKNAVQYWLDNYK